MVEGLRMEGRVERDGRREMRSQAGLGFDFF